MQIQTGTINKTTVYDKSFQVKERILKKEGKTVGTIKSVQFNEPAAASIREHIPDGSPKTSQFLALREKLNITGYNDSVAEGFIHPDNNTIGQINFHPKTGEQIDRKQYLAQLTYEPPLTFNPLDNSITAQAGTKVTYTSTY